MAKTLLSLLIVTMFLSYTATAADTTAAPRRQGIMLVMLHAEKNRLSEAVKKNDESIIATIKKHAQEIRTRTIMDFSENFDAYPVYYIMDSNSERLVKKDFNGLLLNADGTIAQNVPIDTANPNYIVTYYSWGDYMTYNEEVLTDKNRYQDGNGRSHGRGLVVYNNKMQQLFHYYKWEFANVKTLPLEEAKQLEIGKTKRYFYKSGRFDMEYYPMAKRLNKHFNKITNQRG